MLPNVVFDRRGPLLIALIMLAAGLALVVALARRQSDGRFVYALDDAYIHLAIAKNLARDGNWGVSPGEFASASSSLAWPAAAGAVFLLCGVRESVLLVFNVLAAGLAVMVPWSIFGRRKPPNWLMLVMLGCLILATPMIPLAVTGMEHLAHAVVSLIFLYSACAGMVDPDERFWRLRAATVAVLFAPLVTALRYEGMFLIVAVVALEILRRQWLRAASIGALGMLPIVVAGVVFMSHGWFFFPASVIIKTARPEFHSWADLAQFLEATGTKLVQFPHLGMLILVVAFSTLCLGRRSWHSTAGLMGIAFLAAASMHVLFARCGWFYRYEAYLIYLGLTVLMLQWLDFFWVPSAGAVSWTRKLALAVVVVVLAWPMTTRSAAAHQEAPWACTNVYQQQVQMALFLAEYYPGASVAANDVGAINFFADIRCLDVNGQGDLEVARLRLLAKQYDALEADRVARSRDVKIAIIYTHWFGRPMPDSWFKVGAWRIPHNVVCGSDTVYFYALDLDAATALSNHLNQFEKRLPAAVKKAKRW